MKAIWSAAAVRHLQKAIDYLQGESSAGAVTIRWRILATVRCLERMPYSGKPAAWTEPVRQWFNARHT